ncbi:pirin family protein [Mycobacterium sp. M26]|uniref:pirin family protein n=1 Tax=Mycobacterium sp. M26 TaxID=1762962 RepID=UPI00073E5558|nr:pirin family protein [Mycobacterium sp. M26]
MSNLESAPREVPCRATGFDGAEVLQPRDVPLGGPRAIVVRRTLPQRERSLIGAWCFADHYGPQDLRDGPGMDVPPHPHTGLQTVSWLFSGEIEHRDSAGVHQVVRAGELNLMTAGAGICHSEVSTADTAVLHGAQLWVALPEAGRHAGRDFEHFVPEPVSQSGVTIRVFLGALAGQRSPVHTFTPLLGAQLNLPPGALIDLAVDPAFEHGVLLDLGVVDVAGRRLDAGQLAYLRPGATTLRLHNPAGQTARVLLLGGPPFGEDLLMWWNFVARSHDEIVEYRQLWQDGDVRFGSVSGYSGAVDRLPAPPLPAIRLRPRRSQP